MNELRIVSFSSEWEEALDEYVASHRESRLFHTRTWSRVLQASFGHEDRSILAMRGQDIVGFLPLFLIQHPMLGRKAISLPLDGCYGGALTSEAGVAERLAVEAIKLVNQAGLRFVEIRTMQRQEWLRDLGFIEACPMTHSVVLIQNRDENWRRMDNKSARWAVRKAVRDGVTVRASDRPEDLVIFHEILAKSFRAFGSPVWGLNFLRNMRDLLMPGVFRLLVAEHDGRVIGGVILLMFRDIAIYKYGACHLNSYPLHPFNLLLWGAIELCCEEGCKALNTGSNNPRDAGLLRFKRALGGIEGPDYFYRFSANGNPPDYARYFDGYRLGKALWRRLPLPVTLFLGARITKWLC